MESEKMRIVYFGHANAYDYQEMYRVLIASNISKKYELILPHLNNPNKDNSKEIDRCDLVVAEVSLPSTGLGIELGRIFNKKPILCIHRKGVMVSGALKHITKEFMDYKDLPDMVVKLEDYLGRKFK